MPRTKLMNHVQALNRPVVPPPNFVAELLRRYMRAQHLTAADVAARLGCSAQNANYLLARPAEAWRVRELVRFCEAVNCPIDEALAALAKK